MADWYQSISPLQQSMKGLASNYSSAPGGGPYQTHHGSTTGMTRQEFESMLTPEFLTAMQERMQGGGPLGSMHRAFGGQTFDEAMQGPLGRLYGASPDRKPWAGDMYGKTPEERLAMVQNLPSPEERAKMYAERQKVSSVKGRVDAWLEEGGGRKANSQSSGLPGTGHPQYLPVFEQPAAAQAQGPAPTVNMGVYNSLLQQLKGQSKGVHMGMFQSILQQLKKKKGK